MKRGRCDYIPERLNGIIWIHIDPIERTQFRMKFNNKQRLRGVVMNIGYVEDINGWEKWQQKYRYGVLLIFPPEPVMSQVNELRRKYDPQSARLFEEAKKRRYPYSAHMTIAEFITVDQTNMLMEQLGDSVPQGSFICDGVSYAVPDERFRFTERVKFKLA